jgi:hypothetical protein
MMSQMNTRVYSVEAIRKGLNTKEARQATFDLLMYGDDAAFRRTLEVFARRWMINEASKFVEWRSKALAGSLTRKMIRF